MHMFASGAFYIGNIVVIIVWLPRMCLMIISHILIIKTLLRAGGRLILTTVSKLNSSGHRVMADKDDVISFKIEAFASLT